MRGDDLLEPVVRKVGGLLDRFGIRFHLTGGIASVAYGEPRLTQDIDLVVDHARLAAVETEWIAALGESGFVFDERRVRQAIAEGRMFQLLDPRDVVKVDVYTRCVVPGELERSVRLELFPGLSLPLVARRDAVLSKLIWIRRGSHRSRRDVRGMLAGAGADERTSVADAARRMGLDGLLEEVLAESDEIET